MNDTLNNNNLETSADEDIARMKKDFMIGRFTSDFDGMENTTLMKRAEYVRRGLYNERGRRPENKTRIANEYFLESDREDFFPNVHLICEKMMSLSEERFERAKSAYTAALEESNVRTGPKAAGIRRTIDSKYDNAVAKQLGEERKKVDAQKKAMEKYLKMAPDSSYAALINDAIRKNEEGYRITAEYLSAQAAFEKYGSYEKRGVITEEEKKFFAMAKEMESAANLRLINHKQNAYLMQEREAALTLDNKQLMRDAHERFINCEKDPYAFIEIPKEITERLVEYALNEKASDYYQLLQKKEDLKGFHPFKKLALNLEIKKITKTYNEGLALLPDTKENKMKHPPLTTLGEWKKQNGVQAENVEDISAELTYEIPKEIMVEESIQEAVEVKQPVRLDLGDKIHAKKTEPGPVFEKETKKEVREIEEKDI